MCDQLIAIDVAVWLVVRSAPSIVFLVTVSEVISGLPHTTEKKISTLPDPTAKFVNVNCLFAVHFDAFKNAFQASTSEKFRRPELQARPSSAGVHFVRHSI